MSRIIRRQTAPLPDRAVADAIRRLDQQASGAALFFVPTGVVLDWRGVFEDENIPEGWLRCVTDETGSYAAVGSAYEEADTSAPGLNSGVRLRIAEWPRLYAVIGNIYGGKVALGEFRLPDEMPASRIIKT